MLKVYEKNSIPCLVNAASLLENKNILITGAASGTGKALALRCAQQGATVILLDQNEAGLSQVYDQIEANGLSTPLMIPVDLSDLSEQSLQQIVAGVVENCGGLDALVNNAAVLGQLRTLNQYPTDLWQKVLKVNLEAPFLLTKTCMPLLVQAKGSVIFTTCAVGGEPKAYWGAYSVAKSGVESMAAIWASEMESNSVRINLVNPGPVRTQLRAEAFPAEDPNQVPLPCDKLDAYIHLLSNKSSGKITGALFNLE